MGTIMRNHGHWMPGIMQRYRSTTATTTCAVDTPSGTTHAILNRRSPDGTPRRSEICRRLDAYYGLCYNRLYLREDSFEELSSRYQFLWPFRQVIFNLTVEARLCATICGATLDELLDSL
ncbi:hypothetical protein RB195_016133 [Necator americanus]|uniref:Uncharacterized protein n=1 Tax=Necator americanus TaxID=51031 RepID=A0ABR1EAC7_NECAM